MTWDVGRGIRIPWGGGNGFEFVTCCQRFLNARCLIHLKSKGSHPAMILGAAKRKIE